MLEVAKMYIPVKFLMSGRRMVMQSGRNGRCEWVGGRQVLENRQASKQSGRFHTMPTMVSGSLPS